MKYLTLIGFSNIKFYFIEFIPANLDAAQGPEYHPEKQEAEGIVTAQAALAEWLRS